MLGDGVRRGTTQLQIGQGQQFRRGTVYSSSGRRETACKRCIRQDAGQQQRTVSITGVA